MTSLAPLEIASGLLLGLEDGPQVAASRVAPLSALEDAIRPALEQPPCLVSFSGGRDSSAVLATATALARREGLPLPIPATNRFPDVAEANESLWQERVVEALELQDWVRLEFGDELDCVGPVAAAVLREHGLLWPFNAHFHVPLLRAAAGGSLITGIGGDEIYGESRRRRAALVLAGAVRPGRRDVLRLGFALAPHRVRRAVLLRREHIEIPWLTPAALERLLAAWADFAAEEPLRWSRHMRWCARLRYIRLGVASLGLLADDEDVRVVHPFTEAGFLGALASARLAAVDRSATMSALFGTLLPGEVLGRPSKASFDGVFFGAHSRAFAEDWDGEGADRSLVDVDWLGDHWRSRAPVSQTFTQLQAAWLARSGVDRVEQPLQGAFEAVPAGGPPEFPGG
jgi:hypothetical protein